MGQSLSRRPAPTPTAVSAPDPESQNAMQISRPSLPRRILSSLPKLSLRSRPLASSLSLPPRPEQTLRAKKRLWRPSRRHNVPANTEGAVPERMDPSQERDEHHVDRDVDEFGVITHRVPDSHTDTDSPPASTKGKEREKDVSNIDDDIERTDPHPIPSSSTAPPVNQSRPGMHHMDDVEEVVIAPITPLHQPSPLPLPQEPVRPFVPLPQTSTLPTPPQSLSQRPNTIPRPFPPPGTLVVVQGVVHTTDAPRPADRPVAISNPTLPTTNDALNLNNTGFDSNSTRPSSVPPGTRSRNPLSGILTRPTSMLPTVSPSPPSESMIGLNIDSQRRQTTSIASSTAEENEDEDRPRTHPHGISIAQGPVGASGLSATSVDVLGTLLSVAAAATAASLLTGSSEPIFSSGLASSQSPPSSNSVPPPPGFNSHLPSERPLSPTPTSDAGRMRHVWSSLRDRLGLGGGAHDSNQSNDTTSGLGPGQSTTQPADVVLPRDPREIMLAEMARAFNLGLGLGGTTGAPAVSPSSNSNIPELATSDGSDVLSGDREHPVLPPPDSFERFLMDLQTDLRVTLMRDQEPGISGELPQDIDDTTEDAEEDEPIPELQSLTDSDSDPDSDDFETMHFGSDDEVEPDYNEDMADSSDEEDVCTAAEQLSGRTSPAVSALGSGVHSPFGVRTRPGSPSSFGAGGMSQLHTTPLQSPPTAISSDTDCKIAANDSTADKNKNEDVDAVHASSSVADRTGSHVSAGNSRQSGIRPGEGAEGHREGVALGVVHSLEASNGGQRVEAEGVRDISGTIAVPPLDVQDPSNVPAAGTGFLLGTPSLSSSLASTLPTLLPGASPSATQARSQPSTLSPPASVVPELPTQYSTNPSLTDSSMPFRLPFAPSSASRTERTPGGGINWWRMYRFPAIASPNSGQQEPQGSSPISQTAFPPPVQDLSHTTSPWTRGTDQNLQNEVLTSRGMAQSSSVHSGLATPARSPSTATSTNMPQLVYTPNQNANLPLSMSTNGQDSHLPTNTSNAPPEQRGNVVVPVIVVGLQSVNMERQPPHMAHPHVNHPSTIDDEDGEAMDFDGLEQPMSMPLHIPEPPEFRHHTSPSNTTQQEQGGQQPSRGRTWQSRAANAIRNLRPSRRSADATSPPPQDTPGSRTFLIYVIGGYYPPDHQIITGGNLDSFEALWELAEMLGQVKPPTVSKEDIEKSGLEIIKASVLHEYEKQGRVASNCTERCLVCLDDYQPEDELRVLSCKHTFHQGCVDRWLETGRNNCPACRTKGVSSENAGPTAAVPSDTTTG